MNEMVSFDLLVGTREASRFYSNSDRPFRFDSIRKWWTDSKIFESVVHVPVQCPLLVV